MAVFSPKGFQEIVADMAAKMAAETPLTDFTPGSVVLSLIETAAQEDFQQYIQMLQIIRNYNLDTTEGEDLDNRAAEYGLARRPAAPHSGFVDIGDSRFVKISTKIYAGLSGPISGSFTVNVDDASSFPASGVIYVGRGTSNTEGPLAYSTPPVNNTSYWTITLDTALINDHGTDEAIILGQFGNRVVTAGTEVAIPENDFTDAVSFELNQTVELLDGEDSVTDVLVTALKPGGFKVPANSIISFVNSPFTGATVSNPLPFVNGRDEETDQELRDRIRDTVQSLSRGTPLSVQNSIIGLLDTSTNSSIVSANIIPPVILADGPTKVYIDNGRGLEPTIASVGLETIIASATGGEKFFQLDEFPVVKANIISQNVEPFALFGGETITLRVGTSEETFTFVEGDFRTPGTVKATEVVQAINNRATLFEARSLSDDSGRKIFITPVARENENIQLDSASTAQTAFNFSTLEVFTLKLYKNDVLLTKDGKTASIISAAQPFDLSTSLVTTTDGDITVTPGSRIVTKTASGVNPFLSSVHPGDYVKFSSDSNSFYSKVQTVISNLKFILEEAYPPLGGGLGNINIWNSPQLEVSANGDTRETEVVSFSPNDFSNSSQVLASEIFPRLQAEVNLSKVELAVNNTKIKIISNLLDSAESQMRITGGDAALSMGFTTSGPLSGVISTTGGSRSIQGVGTAFTTELEEGQWIKVNADDKGSWTKVETIESDTLLYLREGYRGTDNINQAAGVINFGENVVGQNKDYVLNRSNGQIELNTPLEEGDSLTAGSINTRAFLDSLQETFNFDSLLSLSSTLVIRVDGGFAGIVDTGDSFSPYNDFTSTELVGFDSGFFVGFHIEFISGNNIGETDFISSYNPTTGQVTTATGFSNPILSGDRFTLSKTITFIHATDFASSAAATAQEVVDVINSNLKGGVAEVLEDNSIRIRTSNYDSSGSIQVITGSANTILGFSTEEKVNQDTNTAFAASQNSDREGLSTPKGFTLGPDQTLVLILDGDSANKTFSIATKVEGTAVTGGSNTFTDTSLTTKYTSDDFFNDFWIFWTSGANEGALQVITSYVAVSGTFTTSNVFPTSVSAISSGDEYALVPRTAENVVKLFQDLNTTTLSIFAGIEATGISGDFVAIASNTPGTDGKVYVTGGTANKIGTLIQSIVAGAPVNDVTVNSKAGLTKGLPVKLTSDGTVTTPDASPAYDTFNSTNFITALPSYFDGMDIEFLTGLNEGFSTTISSYDNTTGEFVLADPAVNAISNGDTFRVGTQVFVSDIQGTASPYTISLVDAASVDYDVSGFTPERTSAIRDVNGLNYVNMQVEGVDGYKKYTGLIELAQHTIDGLDRDRANFPGIGASGTQFEVIPPTLVKLEVTLNITTDDGVSLSSISNDVSTAVSGYINSRRVGEDVVLSEIVAAAQSVSGVFDVEISNLSSNVTISDGELARIDAEDLVIG